MKTVSAIHAFAALRDVATVLKTVPDFEQLYEDAFYPEVEYFVAVDKDPDELRRKAMIHDVVLDVDMRSSSSKPPRGALRPRSKRSSLGNRVLRPRRAPLFPQPPAWQAAPSDAKEKAAENRDEDAHKEGDVAQKRGSGRFGPARRQPAHRQSSQPRFRNGHQQSDIQPDFARSASSWARSRVPRTASARASRTFSTSCRTTSPPSSRQIRQGNQEGDLEKYGFLYQVFEGFETDLKTDVAKFRSTAQNLGRITGELQEGVMRIRMVPISQIFSRFPRLVRDLTKTLNKKVNLVIEGEETELDKSVIEDLLDPLMHSVRNALDHGIESPEERARGGQRTRRGRFFSKPRTKAT